MSLAKEFEEIARSGHRANGPFADYEAYRDWFCDVLEEWHRRYPTTNCRLENDEKLIFTFPDGSTFILTPWVPFGADVQ